MKAKTLKLSVEAKFKALRLHCHKRIVQLFACFLERERESEKLQWLFAETERERE